MRDWVCRALYRFNGAGAFQRRKLERAPRRTAHHDHPSMEPAPFSAGNARLVVERDRLPRTFNGAGAFQRRKPYFARARPMKHPSLQWSRRLSAPETPAEAPEREQGGNPSMEPAPFSAGNTANESHAEGSMALQWSRRLSAPETSASSESDALDSRTFNGAGAFQRRKPEISEGRAPTSTAFNGAGAFQRRKLVDER